MCVYLHMGLFILFSVSACLPSPKNVQMIAVDMNYTLQCVWNYTQHNDSVHFTAGYTFWNNKDNEASYKQVCNSSVECWCDFTLCHLHFFGTYQIRVRVETAHDHSNWTYLKFTPDEDGLLSPPREVKMTVDTDMIILTISQSVMSSVMTLTYRVRYWERLNPEQKHLKDYDAPYAPLTSLKFWTEYCVQVSVFNIGFNKTSNFTSPQCMTTTGRPLVWWIVLAVLGCISISGFLLYFCCWSRRTLPAYKIPDSIQVLPLDCPPLLEAQELSCALALVTQSTFQFESPPPQLLQQEPDIAELQAECSQWNSGSQLDSGIGSGAET
ncbi:interferon alpha/beta receptor 1a-like [Hoplias malabaricus]|uniref:interferon alpha/beta receptor 1a-like n=1 Tax=Hoplias malabaricus TaxID=27720 RepID=UPI00346196D6